MGLCNTSIPRDTSGCITTTSSIARFVHFPPLGSRIVDDRERSSSTSGTVETRARNFFEKWERNGDIARDVDAAASARHRRERVTRGDVADILARAFAGERAGRRRVRITLHDGTRPNRRLRIREGFATRYPTSLFHAVSSRMSNG